MRGSTFAVERKRQHGLSRRRDVQRAVRRQPRVPRLDRPIRRSRFHRHAVPRAASRAFRTPSPTSSPALVAANLYRDDDVDWEETTSARVRACAGSPATTSTPRSPITIRTWRSAAARRTTALAFGTGLYESATRYPEPSERRNELLSAEVVADLGFAELTSATGWSKYDEVGQRDQTDLLITLEYSYEEFPTFSAFTREIEKEETFTQEIRLVSKSDGQWNWIAGLFLQDFEQPDAVSREFTPEYDVYLGGSRPDDLEYISVLTKT